MICHMWCGEILGCGWRSHPPNMEGSFRYVEYSFIDSESGWLSSLVMRWVLQILTVKGKRVAKWRACEYESLQRNSERNFVLYLLFLNLSSELNENWNYNGNS